jgi:hypothetical protein
MSLNSSAYFSGLIMIMLNVGSKYITVELSKSQEQLLKNSVGRQVLIFSIIWMGIRDIYKSLIMTAVFVILTDHLFNEKSKFCVLPEYLKALEYKIDTNDDNIVDEVEVGNALKVLDRAKKEYKNRNKLSALNTYMS